MSRLLNSNELKAAVQDATFIKDGDPNCIEANKYDFRLGHRLLKAKFLGIEVDLRDIIKTDPTAALIEPGEVVFVMTEETLDLPQNIKAELSFKRKMAHLGIMLMGGFCVDPQYRGKLIFGMYNFSSKEFPLKYGHKLIAAQFYQLAPEEVSKEAPIPEPLLNFPENVVEIIKMYQPMSLHGLKAEIEAIRVRLDDRQRWVEQFEKLFSQSQDQVRDINRQIQDLLTALSQEKEKRITEDGLLRGEINKVQMRIVAISAGIGVAGAIALVIISKIIDKLFR
jgi:deoxycytidine triphosphate deaminase